MIRGIILSVHETMNVRVRGGHVVGLIAMKSVDKNETDELVRIVNVRIMVRDERYKQLKA